MKKPFIIIGANLTGLCTALALSRLNQSVIIVDKKQNILNADLKDGRAIALSYGSKQILEELNIWDKLEPLAGRIDQIRVTDQLSPLFLHFNNNSTLGYLIESDDIQKIIYENIVDDPNITILTNSSYQLLENNHNKAVIQINEQIFETSLLIAADGKFSNLRKISGIGYAEHNYKQTAIVCKVHHQRSHKNIAQEMFLSNGPFAILPLKNSHNSGIVWTETPEIAEILLDMEKDKLNYFLTQKFTDYLGKVEIISKVSSFPLKLIMANKYYHNRVMLIGDSAHSIHPIAGQGFNLGLRDIACLKDIHLKYSELGLETGCYQSLEEYEKLRSGDNSSMAIITDLLNKLFSNNNSIIGTIRKLGLFGVNQLPSLKNFFMEYAMAKRK